jgi:Kef-type K+ transport system membrane component KefB
VLTFLAGAELDPDVFKRKWKEATTVGLAGFFFPFFGCAAAAYFLLGWEPMPSWLGGVALSTTSVAVVYAVMLESHHIIDQGQYSILVAGVIGSAVVPTLIANAFFLPRHLLPQPAGDDEALAIAEFDEEPTGRPKQLEPTQSI